MTTEMIRFFDKSSEDRRESNEKIAEPAILFMIVLRHIFPRLSQTSQHKERLLVRSTSEITAINEMKKPGAKKGLEGAVSCSSLFFPSG